MKKNRNKCINCLIRIQMNESINNYLKYNIKANYIFLINNKIIPNCEGCRNYLDSITYYY